MGWPVDVAMQWLSGGRFANGWHKIFSFPCVSLATITFAGGIKKSFFYIMTESAFLFQKILHLTGFYKIMLAVKDGVVYKGARKLSKGRAHTTGKDHCKSDRAGPLNFA